ncbi:unnamed protein product, partial [Ectocarpus sp. 6 AP-2014]
SLSTRDIISTAPKRVASPVELVAGHEGAVFPVELVAAPEGVDFSVEAVPAPESAAAPVKSVVCASMNSCLVVTFTIESAGAVAPAPCMGVAIVAWRP